MLPNNHPTAKTNRPMAKSRSRDKSNPCRSQHFLKGGIHKTCGVADALCDHSRTVCSGARSAEFMVLRSVGLRAGRGARRPRFPGAALAPPSRRTSASSRAASRPASAGRDQQVPHVAASRSVPRTEPSLRRGQSSRALRGWELHAFQQAGRGGGRGAPLPASGEASERAEPQP